MSDESDEVLRRLEEADERDKRKRKGPPPAADRRAPAHYVPLPATKDYIANMEQLPLHTHSCLLGDATKHEIDETVRFYKAEAERYARDAEIIRSWAIHQ